MEAAWLELELELELEACPPDPACSAIRLDSKSEDSCVEGEVADKALAELDELAEPPCTSCPLSRLEAMPLNGELLMAD